MKRHWKYITLSALTIIMLMAMAAPALAADKAAEHVLRVKSGCLVSGGGSGVFTFASDNRVDGHVSDLGDSDIYWSADMSSLKMNQGWERVKAQVAVKVWGTIQNYRVVPESDALDGIFSFDLTGVTPTEVDGEDLYENWLADGEWTIMVPSIPIANHELGCFGYNFHTGDPGFYADVWKWLILPV